jgi:hypothetical protein
MAVTTVAPGSVRPIAGDGLLHPIPLAAIAVLIVNDHFLKTAYPGLITGKLSDFAGMIFFPLFLQGVWEVVRAASGKTAVADRRVLLGSVAVTALMFGSMKLVPAANDFWVALLSTFGHSVIALDPTDLIALPALAIAYLVGSARARNT